MNSTSKIPSFAGSGGKILIKPANMPQSQWDKSLSARKDMSDNITGLLKKRFEK